MDPLCTALMVRNEADRYLRQVLDHHGQWGPLVVLDDGSTDDTYDICRTHPAVVVCERREGQAWGAEAPARAQLWHMALDVADWVLIADADQVLSADPRPLCLSTRVNAWAFPLYDLWTDREYRADTYWRGHEFPRPWLFCPRRVPEGYAPTWNPRGIHCGHAPDNFPLTAATAPPEYYWLHYGYATAGDRARKLAAYRGQYHQMTDFEQAHAESIGDPAPSLKVLPFAKPVRILAAAPVRKAAPVLQAHLASLAAQELPDRVEVEYCFIDDNTDQDASTVLNEFVQARTGTVLRNTDTRTDDYDDAHPVTHQWAPTSLERMARLKNHLLHACLQGGYDHLWLVDSDLILDPTTLASMYALQRGIVSAVYWTRWNTSPAIHAAPQVWQAPVYQLGLPHYPEHEFRADLVARKVVKVGGLGACTLIGRSVIEKGVQFGKPPDFPTGGLWDGEDRHFCEWARRLHVDLWADAWPDIFHVYHATDRVRMPDMAARLATPHPAFPNHGHLVSLMLQNLEDGVGPLPVRCRLGTGTLLPELERHVLELRRGESKIVRLHFPAVLPTVTMPGRRPSLGGTVRLVKVTLVDCKPFTLPPVVEDEFHAADGVVQDATHLTPEQAVTFGRE